METLVPDTENQLEAALLKAHADDNRYDLINLYTQAADLSESSGDIEATCFFLTHAYVFSLEIGSQQAVKLNQRLVAHGRESPLT